MRLASFKKGYYQCARRRLLLPTDSATAIYFSLSCYCVIISIISIFPSLKQPHIELMQSKPTDAVRVGVCGHIFPVSRASDHGR